MGSRTNGIEGLLSVADTSTGAVDQTGFDLHHLINSGVGPYSATLNLAAPALESTEWASTAPLALSHVPDINAATMSFIARFPQGAPKTGAEGLVTFANGNVLHVDRYTLNINCSVENGDTFSSTPPTARAFVPGVFTAGGSFEGAVDDTTAIAAAGTTGSATFRIDDDTTDNTFAGAILLDSVSPAIVTGQQNRVSSNYTVNGNLTVAGTAPPLPTGALAKPDITEIVLRASGSRTYTMDAFWSSLSFSVAFGQLIDVSGTLQITSDVTIA